MALTAKERVARWRARQRENSESHEAYKAKERERNRKRKKEGQFHYVADMSPRELRNTRRRWRYNSQLYRKRKKNMEDMLTPPTSPTSPDVQRNNRVESMLRVMRRKRNRDKAVCYKENAKLKIKLKLQERLTEKYKKRFIREKQKHNKPKPDSVSMKVNQNKLYKLYETVIHNIRLQYQSSKSQAQKRMIASLVTSKRILKQYKIGTLAQSILTFSRRHLRSQPTRKPFVKSLRIKAEVLDFYERDDVSRMKPDKQSTITRKGVKKQIRLLNDDLKNLHLKFSSESKNNYKISYSLFCRLRPFWVMKPREKDRQTCMCRIHDNLSLKLKAAYSIQLIKSRDINEIVKNVVCNDNNKACMYRECEACVKKQVEIDIENVDIPSQVEWHEWKTKREEITKNGQVKTVTKVVKSKEQASKEVLADEIQKETERACRHIFNIRHQYKNLRFLKSNLSNNDLLIHIDFSENYAAKYADEIQSMHFGGSRNLICLHTGVMYLHDATYPFCSVSDNLRHDPSAVWAHLHPVLKDITDQRKLNTIHFISDGPATQYKNKSNFFLWAKKIQNYKFTRSTWNFLEASHGKGAADGIGAAVKRSADQEVIVRKKDITSAKDFVNMLSEKASNVKLYLVDGAEIDKIESELPPSIQALPGTMKIHQLIFENDELSSRVVSCFCSHPTMLGCRCFNPCSHRLVPKQVDKESGCDVENLTIDESLVGKFVIVLYDGKPFTGVIQDVDEDDVEVKLEFDVEMTCQKCVKSIENVLTGVEGVNSFNIDLDKGQVIVEGTVGTEMVKNIIEKTGKRAVLKGMGGTQDHLGAAVSIMEIGSRSIRGLIRFIQTNNDTLVIDGTIDGLIPGNKHALCVHECGDISDGCNSCGDVYSSSQGAEGEFGDIIAGPDGRAEFRITNDRIKIWEMIGRSMMIHNCSSDRAHRPGTSDERISCGIIARSAGLFQNSKKICACDGTTQWDERNKPLTGFGRQANL